MKILKGIAIMALALIIPVSVHASESRSGVVSRNKVWTITFNDKVDMSTVDGNIYVKDSKGNRINLDVYIKGDGSRVSAIPPNGGYKSGEKYTLYVDKNVASDSGKSLSGVSERAFEVEEYLDGGSNIEERVKKSEVLIEVYDFDNKPLRSGKGYIIDSKVVTNYATIKDGARAEITLSDGRVINIRSVINYSTSENIAVMTTETNSLPTLNSNVYAEVERVGQLLQNKLTYDTISRRLGKIFDYSLIEVKKEEGSEPELRFVEESIKSYYSNVDGMSNVAINGVYIEKDPNNNSKIDVYLMMDWNNTGRLMDNILFNEDGKAKVETWIQRINNYVSKDYIGYTIETKLSGEIKDVSTVREVGYEYFDHNEISGIYRFKDSIVTHYDANENDYYVWNKGI